MAALNTGKVKAAIGFKMLLFQGQADTDGKAVLCIICETAGVAEASAQGKGPVLQSKGSAHTRSEKCKDLYGRVKTRNTPVRMEYGKQHNKIVGGGEDLQGKPWRESLEDNNRVVQLEESSIAK